MTREEKMNKRRSEGKTYTYSPNPYKKGTLEYEREMRERAAKNVSKKTPTAYLTSIMKKLNNELEQKKAEEAKVKAKKEKK